MNIHSVIEGLNANEKKVLLALQRLEGEADLPELVERAEIDQSAIMRAALSLSERGLVEVKERKTSTVGLTPEGREYINEGLPERRMLVALAAGGEETPKNVAEQAGLKSGRLQIALAWLRRKGWVDFVKKGEENVLKITEKGGTALSQKFPDEELLEKLASRDHSSDEIPRELESELKLLTKRGLVHVDEKTRRSLELTPQGKEVVAHRIETVEEISELTRELLVSGRWRDVKLRRYNVLAPGTPVYPGKNHPQQQIIDELREILLEMGFVEIRGRIVESEFWNFDALFQAQDHPAREIHDSLSVKKPSRTNLPSLDILQRVMKAHERGIAGSTGWGYKFIKKVSRRPVLCSQTTAATVRYLASKPKPPLKIFCIDRVYRHEKIDYKHLAEFYQAEGIVMNPGLTLRDMFGYLRQIVVKLGFKEIRFRPGMFPFTEPSVEADVYHPKRQEWIEILGAGMFRPEVLRPLDIRYPVLAWGIGLTRLAAIRLELKDIRDLFSNDLQWISNFVYLGTQIPGPSPGGRS